MCRPLPPPIKQINMTSRSSKNYYRKTHCPQRYLAYGEVANSNLQITPQSTTTLPSAASAPVAAAAAESLVRTHLSNSKNNNKNKTLSFKQLTDRKNNYNYYNLIRYLRLFMLVTLIKRIDVHIRHILRISSTTTKPNKSILYNSKSVKYHTTISSSYSASKSPARPSYRRCIRNVLPQMGMSSFYTLLTIICLETILISTMSNCAKTFYMHWNTSNSIFRIDNTDHIIDVNKGNLAFEFDQVHIICPVYEPGTYENETEKYIIYNVSKVEYETCRITNADPRVIAICDKPQKLMFFTITFRPFTPQPGGLEFLPGNDYYFISTSSKDDLYRRIGGRCSTNNMKVVFKVCCAPEEKEKTIAGAAGSPQDSDNSSLDTKVSGPAISGEDISISAANVNNHQILSSNKHGNTIGTSSGGAGGGGGMGSSRGGVLDINNNNAGSSNNINNNRAVVPTTVNGGNIVGTSINTNVDHYGRIPMQPNNNNINVLNNGLGNGILLTPGHGGINMQYPGRGYHGQTSIRINNIPNNQHTNNNHNNNNNNNIHQHHYDKHPNEVVKNEELTYNSAANTMPRPFCWHWHKQFISILGTTTSHIASHYTQFTNYFRAMDFSKAMYTNLSKYFHNHIALITMCSLFLFALIHRLVSYNSLSRTRSFRKFRNFAWRPHIVHILLMAG